MDKLLYGAAYYDEYMPYDRLEKDMQMLKKAGMNLIRIAESTWSSEEPQDGIFDFHHVTRVLEAADRHGINVIVGTPTYAIPPWLYKKYPEILVTDKMGIRRPYGARQIMDITNEHYRFHSERIIRKLMEAVMPYKCVIGFQLDNETKHYGTCGDNVQKLFQNHMKEKYNGDLDKLNYDFGLNYWSNRINSWEEFPSVNGTINGSLGSAFEEFRRSLVTEFLKFQRDIVCEYKKPEQFITHNLDYNWIGYSFGVQPDVDHFKVAELLDVAGCDIYHPSQSELTGLEIAFGGDLNRSLKHDNYLVLETEAQGFAEWTPYKNQLRLQAFSHLASGANCVEYWHWHSIHNSFETYWKGVLSHNLEENEVYHEAMTIGSDFARLSDKLINLKKENRVAIMISNEALTSIQWFPLKYSKRSGATYNEIVMWLYKALYELNIECDFVSAYDNDINKYDVLFVPALYSAPQQTLDNLKQYVENGGVLFSTFKTGFTDENLKVWTDNQPHSLTDVFGITYDEFAIPNGVRLAGGHEVKDFMELVFPSGAEVIDYYEHDEWGRYAAFTKNTYGKGKAYYLACLTDENYLKATLKNLFTENNLWTSENDSPVKIRKGKNQSDKTIRYYLNYSGNTVGAKIVEGGKELLSNKIINKNDTIEINKWDFIIVES